MPAHPEAVQPQQQRLAQTERLELQSWRQARVTMAEVANETENHSDRGSLQQVTPRGPLPSPRPASPLAPAHPNPHPEPGLKRRHSKALPATVLDVAELPPRPVAAHGQRPSAAPGTRRPSSDAAAAAPAAKPPAPSGTAPAMSAAQLASSGQSVLELLRIEQKAAGWVEHAEAEIAAGLALLAEVRRTADGLGLALGGLWQELLQQSAAAAAGGGGGGGGASAGGGGGGERGAIQRTPLRRHHRSMSEELGAEAIARAVDEGLSDEQRRALCAGAARLRGLLRLSLMDDNDLQLARRALREATAFFEALRAAAGRAGRTPRALWASVQEAGARA